MSDWFKSIAGVKVHEIPLDKGERVVKMETWAEGIALLTSNGRIMLFDHEENIKEIIYG